MAVERVFMGWDTACLPAAAAELARRFGGARTWDMRRVVVATPGARAGRRLLELLARRAQAEGTVLKPPSFATVGELPETMYAATEPVADELTCLLTWADVLRTADLAVTERLLPRRPDGEDFSAWLPVARELFDARAELSGEGLSCADIAACCAGQIYDDSARWLSLGQIGDLYEARLHSLDPPMRDTASARRDALHDGAFLTGRTIVLVATADLTGIVRRMLDATPATVVSLVQAPESHEAFFDRFGCVLPEAWRDWCVPLDDSSVRVVDSPRDQAFSAIEAIEEWNETLPLSKITVGAGDSALTGQLARTIEASGRRARPATGRSVGAGLPATMLAALAAYIDGRNTASFAAALRHPDIERYLTRTAVSGGDARWITALDRFRTNHLPPRVENFWPPEAADARAVREASMALTKLTMPLAGARRSLGEWCEPIAAVLAAAYDDVKLNIHDAVEWRTSRELEAIADTLRRLREASDLALINTTSSASDAIRLLLSLVSTLNTPDEPEADEVEILGWLELQLDDADALAITGFNEGHIPLSSSVDPFLPDSLRTAAGLVSDTRRYSRDLYTLTAIIASRPHVRVIAGRRTADGDALKPSRLLFACGSDDLARRARDFYAPAGPSAEHVVFPHAAGNALATIPLPARQAVPPARVRVTAFRDYIACPYRFYLRHILKRSPLTDDFVEMESNLFGTLAHDTLRQFARSEVKNSVCSDEIRAFLHETVDGRAMTQFGEDRLPAVEIQLSQLRRRMDAFASFQAAHAAGGWLIDNVEADAEAIIETPAGPVKVTGRIDRIDRRDSGEAILIDYKTGDTFRTPKEKHIAGGEWIDLQLPLYRLMAPSLKIEPARMSVGYICLCKDLGKIGYADSEWGDAEFDSASAKIVEVASAIREQRFWPPREPSRFVDGFEGVCLDRSLSRARTIAALTAGGAI